MRWPVGWVAERVRARDLGIRIGALAPGPHNAITDVEGTRVGHATVSREADPAAGRLPVRTGVTVVIPQDSVLAGIPVFAGSHILNGNGEMTGLAWVAESGCLTSPIAITNTNSVGLVRDALIALTERRLPPGEMLSWGLPVVAETWDGLLSDISGMHVTREHVAEALNSAAAGPVAEGCVGGGTGMTCHEFKGGIGTSSRVLPEHRGGWTVGVLVQANYGVRERLRIDGIPVGRMISRSEVPSPRPRPDGPEGSIIVIVATDAPLLPGQCTRLAQRATIGLARAGGDGANSSGDLFLAYATGNRDLDGVLEGAGISEVRMISQNAMSGLFTAAAEATEEAIVNALCAATTTAGLSGRVAHALPLDRVAELVSAARASGLW